MSIFARNDDKCFIFSLLVPAADTWRALLRRNESVRTKIGIRSLRRLQRQGDGESAAPVKLTLNFDGALVGFSRQFHDRQP